MQQMPIRKHLAYLFARATRQDLLCSRMAKETVLCKLMDEFDHSAVYTMDKYCFRWTEARPVPDGNNQYTIHRCLYSRNEHFDVSGDREYEEDQVIKFSGEPYFTRAEAEAILKNDDLVRQKTMHTPDQPYALRKLSVYRSLGALSSSSPE